MADKAEGYEWSQDAYEAHLADKVRSGDEGALSELIAFIRP